MKFSFKLDISTSKLAIALVGSAVCYSISYYISNLNRTATHQDSKDVSVKNFLKKSSLVDQNIQYVSVKNPFKNLLVVDQNDKDYSVKKFIKISSVFNQNENFPTYSVKHIGKTVDEVIQSVETQNSDCEQNSVFGIENVSKNEIKSSHELSDDLKQSKLNNQDSIQNPELSTQVPPKINEKSSVQLLEDLKENEKERLESVIQFNVETKKNISEEIAAFDTESNSVEKNRMSSNDLSDNTKENELNDKDCDDTKSFDTEQCTDHKTKKANKTPGVSEDNETISEDYSQTIENTSETRATTVNEEGFLGPLEVNKNANDTSKNQLKLGNSIIDVPNLNTERILNHLNKKFKLLKSFYKVLDLINKDCTKINKQIVKIKDLSEKTFSKTLENDIVNMLKRFETDSYFKTVSVNVNDSKLHTDFLVFLKETVLLLLFEFQHGNSLQKLTNKKKYKIMSQQKTFGYIVELLETLLKILTISFTLIDENKKSYRALSEQKKEEIEKAQKRLKSHEGNIFAHSDSLDNIFKLVFDVVKPKCNLYSNLVCFKNKLFLMLNFMIKVC